MGKDKHGKELGEGITQSRNGKYQARFRRSDGKRVIKTFEKVSEAKAWLLEVKYENEHEGVLAGSEMTMDSWFDYWIEEIMSPNLKYNTIVSYKGRYRNRISPIIGQMPLKDILPIHCQQVINASQAKDDAVGSVLKIKSIMGSIFAAAVENQLIKANPITKSVKCIKGETPTRTILTYNEQCEFMRVGREYAHFDAFVFILNTGLRYGEMSALRWQDIDWQNRLINVKGTMYYDKDKKCFAVNSPKTKAGYRMIPLTDEAYEILQRIKKERAKKPISMQYHEFVFIGKEGRPLKNYAYNKCLARIANRIGVLDLTMHSLRHTFATRCIEDGMKPNVLQKLLGHSSIAMTMDLYVHVTYEERISEMNKMDFPSFKTA